MKVILVFVSTLDGKVTQWGSPHVREWSSIEDQEYYKKVWKDARLIVMGSNTFDAEHFSASASRLLIVLTKDIPKYKKYQVAGQVEFVDQSPLQLVQRFQKLEYETMAVVGGPHVATSFFKDQLIDEVWLTIEPKIFGTGGGFVIEEELDINLTQISCEKVNDQGTMITKYKVVKE